MWSKGLENPNEYCRKGGAGMKFDHSKLLGRIKECGYTQKSLAEAIKMNSGTLSLKLNNGSQFNAEEMDMIAELLDISPCNIGEYFFKK